ncbi:MAG: NAD+ synthase, partial [Pseudomonadota bacterium]
MPPSDNSSAAPFTPPSTGFDIVMAQVNTHVGDFDGNLALIEQVLDSLPETDIPTVVVFPELTLCGYPPEDLLLRPSMQRRVDAALDRLCDTVSDRYVVLGYPRVIDGNTFNMAGIIHRGELMAEYAKQCLPNYQVFDEKRYFTAGDKPCVFEVAGVQVGLTICEDIWEQGPAAQAHAAGAELILNLNSSPFHRGKQAERESTVAARARENALPIVYVNQLGGQDELVFDGGSFAVDSKGAVVARSPAYIADLQTLFVRAADGRVSELGGTICEPPELLESVYQALVLGVRDYVDKNGFKGVVLGLSGGIDSALTLAVAADALGPNRVGAVMMPFRYTSEMSVEDAAAQSKAMGVSYKVISIEPVYEAFVASLKEEFSGLEPGITEENIQARCRGVLLMSISNKKGVLVLTTGNKSEMAVGYSTLYGDMAGGFDVLKDVPKTL